MIDTVYECLSRRGNLRVIGKLLFIIFFGLGEESKAPYNLVNSEGGRTHNFRELSRCEAADELHLEQAFLSHDKAKGKVGIMLIFRFDMGDAPFVANNLNLWRPNAGAGVFFNTNHFYLGLSAPDLIENSVNGTNEVLGVDDQARERRHFFVHTGFITGTDESPFRFKPSFLLKYVPGAPINFDVNAQFWIQNRVWLGASYRLEDAVVGMLGIQLTNWLNVGYAYDYTISELSNVSNGSHEIMLGIDLNFKRMGMVSPRWF